MSRFRSPRGRRSARSARVVVAPSGRQLVYLNADASGIVQAYIENADGSDAQLITDFAPRTLVAASVAVSG